MTLAVPAAATPAADLERTLASAEPWPARLEALDELARRDGTSRRELLSAVVENERESPQLRGAAAFWLGRAGDTATLVRLLADSRLGDAAIRAQLLLAIGYLGGGDTLAALRTAAAAAPEGRTRRLARFAAALVSHRHGLDGADLAPVERLLPPPANGTPIVVRRATDAETAACLAALTAESLHLEYAREQAWHFQCDRNERLLILNRDLAGRGGLARLRQRQAVVGVVADRGVERSDYSTGLLVLSSPARGEGEVALQLCRPTGEPILAGGATVGREGLHFELRAVARPGDQPLRLDGYFADGEVVVTDALAGPALRPRRTPTVEPRRR